ncbi:MAG TPA: tetratricopeptide repeat protein [Candidatus Methylomirabilis sp.]|nr:tetratricopeptide repeat protein [Candidatus Methylomirabilis sp.]
MGDRTWLGEAKEYFRKGYEAQMQGDLEAAINHYRRSIELCPTAEAHTFLGWAYSHQGHYDEAIRECKVAIQVDPDFGNPYNDIGAYLIELGRHDEAVPWLRKAMEAPRYDPRHYPHMNLARVYLKQGKVLEAVEALKRALEIEPKYVAARRELHRLLGMLN